MKYNNITEDEVHRCNQRLLEVCSLMTPIVTKDFTIYIRQVHFSFDAKPVVFHTHMHRYFEIGFGVQKKIIYEIDNVAHKLQNSTRKAVLIPSEHPHSRKTEISNSICFGIVVDFQCKSQQAMKHFIYELKNKNYLLQLSEQTFSLLKDVWDMSYAPYTPLSYNILCMKLSLLLIAMLKDNFQDTFIEKQQDAPPGDLLSIIEEYLENYLCDENIISIIQKKCGISRRHINRIFARKYNMPLGQYIIGERLRLASRLLLNSNANIKNIALECGFWNMSYFSRQFKKAFNLTPSEYRLRG